MTDEDAVYGAYGRQGSGAQKSGYQQFTEQGEYTFPLEINRISVHKSNNNPF